MSETGFTPPGALQQSTSESAGVKPRESSEPYRFTVIKDPEQRRLLAEAAMKLVNMVRKEHFDTMVFLDKAARPVQTLFRDLWHKKNEAEHIDTSIPNVNFLNVGSEKRNAVMRIIYEKMGRELTEETLKNGGDVSEIDYSDHPDYFDLNDYKATYDKWLRTLTYDDLALALGRSNDASFDDETAKIWGLNELQSVRQRYSHLANLPTEAKVLILDEYSQSGQSLKIAETLIRRAFPNTIQNRNTISLATVGGNSFASRVEQLDQGGKLFQEKVDNDIHFTPQWRKESDGRPYDISNVGESTSSGELIVSRARPELAREKTIQRIAEYKQMIEEDDSTFAKDNLAKVEKKLLELDKEGLPNINTEMHAIADEYWKSVS